MESRWADADSTSDNISPSLARMTACCIKGAPKALKGGNKRGNKQAGQ